MDTRKWWLIIWEEGHPLTEVVTLNKDWCSEECAKDWARSMMERGAAVRMEVWDDNPKLDDAKMIQRYGEIS